MIDIDAARICPECGYTELATRNSQGEFAWEGDLHTFAERCVRQNVMPGECPHFRKADIHHP